MRSSRPLRIHSCGGGDVVVVVGGGGMRQRPRARVARPRARPRADTNTHSPIAAAHTNTHSPIAPPIRIHIPPSRRPYGYAFPHRAAHTDTHSPIAPPIRIRIPHRPARARCAPEMPPAPPSLAPPPVRIARAGHHRVGQRAGGGGGDSRATPRCTACTQQIYEETPRTHAHKHRAIPTHTRRRTQATRRRTHGTRARARTPAPGAPSAHPLVRAGASRPTHPAAAAAAAPPAISGKGFIHYSSVKLHTPRRKPISHQNGKALCPNHK